VAAVISGKSAYKIKSHRNVNAVFLYTVCKQYIIILVVGPDMAIASVCHTHPVNENT
jgi:hypothetical protein